MSHAVTFREYVEQLTGLTAEQEAQLDLEWQKYVANSKFTPLSSLSLKDIEQMEFTE